MPYFENARAAAPGAAGDRFRILLADALIETGAYRDALATLAPVADPTRLAKTYFLKAKAYCKMGDRRSASAAATLALRYDPTMKEAETFITK